MTKQFALDLKVARKNSGLSQGDCAHLLDTKQPRVSDLESGRAVPTVMEICTLSYIYGRSFDSLFADVFQTLRQALSERLGTLPDCAADEARRFNRQNTLSSLADRLAAETSVTYGGAA